MLTLLAAMLYGQPLILLDGERGQSGHLRTYRNDGADWRNEGGFDDDEVPTPPPATLLAFMYPNDGNTSTCLCASPNVYSGQTFTLGRASTATCNRQGHATSGIAAGDLVTCAVDQARVERNTAGDLALRLEVTRTNSALRTAALDHAAWTTGTTATVTANTDTAPDGTLAGDTLTDNDGAAVEYIQQTFATTNWTATFSVYLKAGTLSAGDLFVNNIAGSGSNTCAFSGLSATTWTRVACTAAIAGGAGTNVRIRLGANAAAQGTLIAWGGQVEAGGTVSSYMPADNVAVTRANETATITLAANIPVLGSAALTQEPAASDADTIYGPLLWVNGATRLIYRNSSVRAYDGTNEPAIANGVVALTPKRYSTSWGNALGFILKNETDAVSATSAFTDAVWTGTVVGLAGVDGVFAEGLVSRVCIESTRAGCQQ